MKILEPRTINVMAPIEELERRLTFIQQLVLTVLQVEGSSVMADYAERFHNALSLLADDYVESYGYKSEDTEQDQVN